MTLVKVKQIKYCRLEFFKQNVNDLRRFGRELDQKSFTI
jgi:hypothetical protein